MTARCERPTCGRPAVAHVELHHPDGDVERFTLCELCIDALCLLQLEMVPGVRRVLRPVATS